MTTQSKLLWNKFRDSGMLWWTNRILHTFGWTIVYMYSKEYNREDNELIAVFPDFTDNLGFPPEAEARGIKRFRNFIKEDM